MLLIGKMPASVQQSDTTDRRGGAADRHCGASIGRSHTSDQRRGAADQRCRVSVRQSDTSDRRCGADELLLLETPNHLTVL